jgi:20S proteasome alpha/beta subunit
MAHSRIFTPPRILRDVPKWERRDVTVCIAAICAHKRRPAIVCCTDMQGTYGDFIKSDDEFKFHGFGKYCVVLKAGDPSDAKELVGLITPALFEFYKQEKTPLNFDLRISQLLHRIKDAVRKRKISIAEHYLGTNYLMTVDEFKASSDRREYYTKIQQEISALGLGCELIIADVCDVEPVLIEIGDDCSVRWQGNYVCIGHGRPIALAVLCQDTHDETAPMMDCVAKVLFAKTACEKDPTVGTNTVLIAMTDEGHRPLTQEGWAYFNSLIKPIRAPKDLEFKESFFHHEPEQSS